jgi:hypothetical protein
MGLRDLSSAKMVAISGAWLDPSKERPLLERLSRVRPLLPDLDEAHHGLQVFQQRAPTGGEKARPMVPTTTRLDAQHDRLARGVHGLCGALAMLTEDPAESEAFLTLQRQLMPQGLSITRGTYLEEAGQAELVNERLSPASNALLESTQVRGRSLREYVDSWRTTAKALGTAEADKTRLAAEPSTGSRGFARNAWTTAVNALLHMLEREKTLTADERRQLLEPLETALAKAATAKARAAAGHPVAAAEVDADVDAE